MVENRRWYNRKGSQFTVKIISPFLAWGIVVNASDGGLLLNLESQHATLALREGEIIQMFVKTEDPNRLLPEQKIQGEVTRVDVDQSADKILVAVEVIGPWEDLAFPPSE
jgi:hypothetical protein